MEENNKDKILKEAENSDKEIDDRIELTRKQRFANKVHPNGSLILMFVIIILLGVAIGTIYLDNFVKVSICSSPSKLLRAFDRQSRSPTIPKPKGTKMSRKGNEMRGLFRFW